MQWNLRIPAPLRVWADAGLFQQALFVAGGRLIQVLDNVPWVTVDLVEGMDPLLLPGILQAEPSRPVFLQSHIRAIPQADTDFSWATYRVKADLVHPITSGMGAHIAVLDTGFSPHPEFSGADINTVETTLGGDAVDNIGHGTLVLGLLAAQGAFVLGAAPGAMYHIIKVIDEIDGVFYGSDATVAAGVERAQILGADIISMSLVTPSSSMLKDAIVAFTSVGGIVVCAAGNSGEQVDHLVEFPAILPDTIAVGALDRTDQWAPFSSWGTWPISPDCVAPGVGVGTTYLSSSYATFFGTSAATPLVAGCLALSMVANPGNWTVSGLSLDVKYDLQLPSKTVRARELLCGTSRAVGGRDRTGYGLVDAVRLTEAFQPCGQPGAVVSLLPWVLVGVGVVAVGAIFSQRSN